MPRPDLPLPPTPQDPALIEAVDQLRASWRADDIGPNAFWTNSVWQAELVLWDFVKRTRTLAEPWEVEPERYLHPLEQMAARPLFRGEPFDKSDPQIRSLTSSAMRQSVPYETVVNLNRLFARLVDHVIAPVDRYGVEVSESSWWAVARHYGMPSTLLDLTADPSVAAHFADRATSRHSAVYLIPAEWCINRGLRILFPPPSCDRLYLQRGLLLDTTRLAEGELLEASTMVFFPPSGHHRVIRPMPASVSGQGYWSTHAPREVDVDAETGQPRRVSDWHRWLGRPQEHWFARVVTWVKEHVDETGPSNDVSGLARQVIRAVGRPQFLEGTSWDGYARALTSLLIWAAGYEIRTGSFTLDPGVRDQLVRDNPFLGGADSLPWAFSDRLMETGD